MLYAHARTYKHTDTHRHTDTHTLSLSAPCAAVLVKAEFEQHYTIPKPAFCPNSLEGVPCDSTKFTALDTEEDVPKACRDYQV